MKSYYELPNKSTIVYPIHIIVSCCLLFLFLGSGCNLNQPLPILGERTVETKWVNGQAVVDTVFQTISNFSLVNQLGDTVTRDDMKGKVAVVDFFFTSCPTICPVMKKEMINVYNAYKNRDDVVILSHTIDPEHDTIELLNDYSNRLGSDGIHWQFLTGNRDDIYELAEKGYYATAAVDAEEPGGLIHSGGFILVDKLGRVRGIYDGTSTEETQKLIAAISQLLDENQ